MPSLLAAMFGLQGRSATPPEGASPERALDRRSPMASDRACLPRSPTGRAAPCSPWSPLSATHSPSRGLASSPLSANRPPQPNYPPLSPPSFSGLRHAIERAAPLPADAPGADHSGDDVDEAVLGDEAARCSSTASPPRPVPVGAQLLPRFFFPGEGGRGRGRPRAEDALEAKRALVDAAWRGAPSLGLADFSRAVCRDLVGLPAMLGHPLLLRVNRLFDPTTGEPERVKRGSFLRFWEEEVAPFDEDERFFRLLAQPGASYAVVADLRPLVDELVAKHPGLQFLQDAAEFQEKYALTVATRIMYEVNTSRTGLVSEKEARRARLLAAWHAVEEQDDINRVERFFSYEHFYVLYCRYWELDSDHDGIISTEELLKYGGHRLSRAIVDRIFAVGHRPLPPVGSPPSDRSVMRYDDFIYFMLSEEDKGNAMALKFWFDCVDVDGDAVVTSTDMRLFYDTQSTRMASLGHDVVSFADVLCQMSDMIKPAATGLVTMHDLVKPEVIANAGVVFDALFNLDKFVSFEQRDPFAERHKRDDPFNCDWDRFAYAEYNRLAAEEEAREELGHMNDSLGEWGA